jgi:hypothetical protein
MDEIKPMELKSSFIFVILEKHWVSQACIVFQREFRKGMELSFI